MATKQARKLAAKKMLKNPEGGNANENMKGVWEESRKADILKEQKIRIKREQDKKNKRFYA